MAIKPIAGIRYSDLSFNFHKDLKITTKIERYASKPIRPVVTNVSTNMLWARSKRVSDPGPLKNFGLKYLENGTLKFSGPQPTSIVFGPSLQPFKPACQAQNRV